MEVVSETETNVLIANEEPEFVPWSNDQIDANYFILCEDGNQNLSKNICEYDVCGKPVLSWVQRACKNKPVALRCSGEENIISLIRPYTSGAEYSVVLYSNTPLISARHIQDMLAFVKRKHMGVCKLKRGYIFKNEYIQNVDEFFSVDTYDFSTCDFFEVNNLADLEEARKILQERIFEFLWQENVVLLCPPQTVIDADVQVGEMTKISGNVSILENTKIGMNNDIGANVVIKNSKLGDDIIVGDGVIIENSVIKDGAVIESGSIVKNSVLGERVLVGSASKILSSAVKQEVQVGSLVSMIGAKLSEGQVVKNGITILAGTTATLQNVGVLVADSGAQENSEKPNYSSHYDDEDVDEFKRRKEPEKYGLVFEEDLDSDRTQKVQRQSNRQVVTSQSEELYDFGANEDDVYNEVSEPDYDETQEDESRDLQEEAFYYNQNVDTQSVQSDIEEDQEPEEVGFDMAGDIDFDNENKVLPRKYVSFEKEPEPQDEDEEGESESFYAKADEKEADEDAVNFEVETDREEKDEDAVSFEPHSEEDAVNFEPQVSDDDTEEEKFEELSYLQSETQNYENEPDNESVYGGSEETVEDDSENESQNGDGEENNYMGESDEYVSQTNDYVENNYDDENEQEDLETAEDKHNNSDFGDISSYLNLSSEKYKSQEEDNAKYGKYYENYKFSNYDINLDDDKE